MKVEATKKITIDIEGEEITTLKSALKKVSHEISKPGLKNNTITTEEADIIKTLNDQLK
jgi:hypothetical protein